MSLTLRGEHLLEYSNVVRQWLSEVAADEILVSPLFGKDGLMGAITVDNRRGGRRFTADDITLIEGLSNQASIAVENARLVEDLRRSREQIRRADRLGSLGMLAAGLAHEINNPLVAINTFLAMAPAKRAEADLEFWGEYHALTVKEVDRIRELLRTMRRLGQAGAGGISYETFGPDEVAREVVTLLHREAELGRVGLILRAESATPKIVAARDQIHQVVLNLVLNALSVTPPEGEVIVRTGPAPDGNGVEIEVRDTGPGHQARAPRADFRSILHHEGPRRRHGPRPDGVPPDRDRSPRHDRGDEPRGARGGVPGASAARRPRAERRVS